MQYYHVDVFADEPLRGNGLTVAFAERDLDAQTLLRIAQEFRQFETVFSYPEADGRFPVRIFTVQEELPFAGHPILGTAAILHKRYFPSAERREISIGLGSRALALESRKAGGGYAVTMNQGKAAFIAELPTAARAEVAPFFGLGEGDIDRDYPLEVVSTGLEYLLVPVAKGLGRARVAKDGLGEFLSRHSARFAYLFDPATLECRCWDNTGAYEDVATGSAAGPLVASLVRHGRFRAGEKIALSQGAYLGRPSVIAGRVSPEENPDVFIEGNVAFFGEGTITVG